MKVLARVLLYCALLLCCAAHSEVLYQTGFDSPVNAVSMLGVQDGW